MLGNYGIADQRAAMAWVHEHIGAFGGNGSDVTVFGESAGGNSVLNHLAQKASFPLYRRAVIESGTYDSGAATLADAEAQFASVQWLAKCQHGGSADPDGLACLRKLSPDALRDVAVSQGALLPKDRGWGPVVDGVALPQAPLDLIRAGAYNKAAPVVAGTNRDEMAYFLIAFGVDTQLDEAGLEATLPVFGLTANATDLAALKRLFAIDGSGGYAYPPRAQRGDKYSDWWWVAQRMLTDGVPALGACSNRRLARLLLQGGTPAVFNYLFAHPTQSAAFPGFPGLGPGSVTVPHASEIAYVFGGAYLLAAGEEAALAAPVSAYWLNFARGANPNGPGLPQWPRYTDAAGAGGEGDVVLRLDVGSGGIAAQRNLRQKACDYMDRRTVAPKDAGKLAAMMRSNARAPRTMPNTPRGPAPGAAAVRPAPALQSLPFCGWNCNGICVQNTKTTDCDPHHCAPWCGGTADIACTGLDHRVDCTAQAPPGTGYFCGWNCNGVCVQNTNTTDCDPHHCAPWCGGTANGACNGFSHPVNCTAPGPSPTSVP